MLTLAVLPMGLVQPAAARPMAVAAQSKRQRSENRSMESFPSVEAACQYSRRGRGLEAVAWGACGSCASVNGDDATRWPMVAASGRRPYNRSMLARKPIFPNVVEMNFQAGEVLGCCVYLVFDGSDWLLIDI